MTFWLRAGLILAVTGAVVFPVCYSWWSKGACWRNMIGLSLQLEVIFFGLGFVPLLLAEFFHLNFEETHVGAWVLIVFWLLGGVMNFWRTVVFGIEHYRGGRKDM